MDRGSLLYENDEEAGNCAYAVSYTHLDVYKRQVTYTYNLPKEIKLQVYLTGV